MPSPFDRELYFIIRRKTIRLSFKQALALVDILKASLTTPSSVGGYPLHIRQMLVHQIINQQDDTLYDLLPGEELEWKWEDLDSGTDDSERNSVED